jgi:hypothetical protein
LGNDNDSFFFWAILIDYASRTPSTLCASLMGNMFSQDVIRADVSEGWGGATPLEMHGGKE